MKDLEESVSKHRSEVDASLEEEREERGKQYDDLVSYAIQVSPTNTPFRKYSKLQITECADCRSHFSNRDIVT